MIAAPQQPVGSSVPVHSSIRVLFIIDSIWGVGGAEMCLLRMVKQLGDLGCECRVLTFNSNDEAIPFRNQFPCEVIHWQLETLRGFTAFRIGMRLRELVRREKIDIVHTFFHTSDLWAGPLAKLSGAKILISSRRDMGFRRGPLDHVAYRVLRSCYDQVHAVSEQVRQYVIDTDGLDPARTLTVHNGVEETVTLRQHETDELRRLIPARPDQPIVTCVANLRRVKGIDVLIHAAALVKKSFPTAHFVVAGGFGANENLDYSQDSVRLSKSLGLESTMTFIGQTTAVPELLQLSDIFVLPSRTEGLSNALLEAMSSGLACVATSVGGNPEVVVDGQTGFIVPSDNPAQLASRILYLLENPEERAKMGALGRLRVRNEFSSESMTRQVRASYDDLLLHKASRS